MERGDQLISRSQQHADANSGEEKAKYNQHAQVDDAVAQANNVPPPPPCLVREQDQYMPIANVIRIMRRILPAHAKISDDAKETIQECVSEYISFITGEANERCQKEQRKTITAEDVLWAMAKLGFDDYVEPLSLFLARYRECEHFRPTGYQLTGSHPNLQSAFDPSMMGGSGLYGDALGMPSGGSSSSHQGMPMYDPFAEFK